jgi:hypothetical protein
MCRPLTRRELLKYAALVAATFPASKVLRPGWSLAEEAAGPLNPAVPMNLELVTVTDTQAAVTWFTGDPTTPDEFGRPLPVAAPGRVLIGTRPNPRTWREVGAHGPTPYHYVEIDGLRQGRRYYYRAESNGVQAVPTVVPLPHPDPSNAGTFTTLVPPPGPELLRVAWLNDLHMGEQVSGLAISNPALPGGGFPPGFPADPDNPYWRFMARAAVAEAAGRAARLMLVNGDISNEAEPPILAEARSTLDAFGTLGGTTTVTPATAPVYFVTRGNHDRPHEGELYEGCPPAAGFPGFHDCFLETFAGGFEPGTAHFTVGVEAGTTPWRFVGLDSVATVDGTGQMPDAELDFLEAELDRGHATIALCHHMVGQISTLTAMPPIVFGVEPRQAARFRELIARHPNVAGIYNGHTHRNLRSRSLDTGDLPYFEGGAVKEYPGGYTVVRLYADGYMVNFWKTKDPEARAWSERSRGEYLGLYPYYTLGGLRDRNWVRRI